MNTVPHEKNARLVFGDLTKGFTRNFKETKNQKNGQNNIKKADEAYEESKAKK